MTHETQKKRRTVTVRRTLAMGTIAATTLGGAAEAAGKVTPELSEAPDWIQVASAEGEDEGEGEGEAASHGEGEGEGEGEGGGAMLAPEAGLIRDLGFMEGHLRAGMALYRTGDLAAANTHMGHPIEEKYGAVAEPLAARGLGRLEQELGALAAAAEAGAPADEIAAQYDTVLATIDEGRNGISAARNAAGLVALTRVAADEYTVATEGGQVSNLHEYQDSWGFLQVVADEASDLAGSGNPAAARAGKGMLAALEATDAVFGELQGGGDFEMDASVIYGAAARMQLAASGL